MEQTKQNAKILIVTGERRGESSGRAQYNVIEIHRANATAKAHRFVHHWRAVINHSERDIWEILRRHTNENALWQTKTGIFTADDVFAKPGEWDFPVGAFCGSDGGPC